MSLLTIELQKEKRTGVIPVLIVVGILGAACPDGCFTDPALWYASDFKYVWHHRCHLYDLQYGI